MPTMPTKKPAPVSKVLPSAARKLAASRRPVEDEAEAEAPAPRKSLAKKAPAAAVQEGWDGAENQRSDSSFPTQPKVEKGDTFYYKHIDDKPYASVRVHWIDRKGKMSFLCSQTADCPLCMTGDTPKFESRFNIAVLTVKDLDKDLYGAPVLRTLNVGQQAFDAIKAYHLDKRTGPLSSRFYSRTRPTGPGGRWKVEVFKRDSDLEDEISELGLKLYIPTDAEIAELGRWTKEDALKEVNMTELQAIADEINGDYDND